MVQLESTPSRFMFESVNEKFPDLKCGKCGKALPLGTKVRVKTDISGWLLYALCLSEKDCARSSTG
jgi:hypothetical protein